MKYLEPQKRIDEENINDANLYKCYLGDNVKDLWEQYMNTDECFDGFEIPLRLNWHNGKSYYDINNYFKISIIAIFKSQWNGFYPYGYVSKLSMTDIINGWYSLLKQDIGKLIYSTEDIKPGCVYLFGNNGYRILKSFKYKSYDIYAADKRMCEMYIVGIKLEKYEKFPYGKFIDVIGPKETYFLEDILDENSDE